MVVIAENHNICSNNRTQRCLLSRVTCRQLSYELHIHKDSPRVLSYPRYRDKRVATLLANITLLSLATRCSQCASLSESPGPRRLFSVRHNQNIGASHIIHHPRHRAALMCKPLPMFRLKIKMSQNIFQNS